MATQIFVNLPVKDLNRSVEFFTQLGYTFNAQFTDENATCMIVGENIYVMLLVEPYFKTFMPKEVCNTSQYAEVLVAVSFDSRAAVDTIVAKAIAAGGTTYQDPQDYGFMYQHGFQDLDGHIWEVFFMDPNTVNPT